MTVAEVLDVTVVVPTKNEEANLAGCLSTLREFSAVVVVDSGSTDGTPKIADQFHVPVIQFHWDGGSEKKRNWVLRTHQFSTAWVLFLDADERVTPEFVSELRRILPDTTRNGFWVRYDNYFLGKRLRFGDPMRKLPLLRVGTGEFEKTSELRWSKLDMEVHEHLVVRGAVGELRARLIHDDAKSLDHWFDRHNAYASWEAERFLALDSGASLTARQRVKYALIQSALFPFAYFLFAYVLRLGFLDGAPGLYFNLSKLSYFSQVVAKARAARNRAAATSSEREAANDR